MEPPCEWPRISERRAGPIQSSAADNFEELAGRATSGDITVIELRHHLGIGEDPRLYAIQLDEVLAKPTSVLTISPRSSTLVDFPVRSAIAATSIYHYIAKILYRDSTRTKLDKCEPQLDVENSYRLPTHARVLIESVAFGQIGLVLHVEE